MPHCGIFRFDFLALQEYIILRNKYMKKRDKILLGSVAAVALAGVAVYSLTKCDTKKRLKNVANEGYETAHDILYPHKKHKKRKLKFGPVLPMLD